MKANNYENQSPNANINLQNLAQSSMSEDSDISSAYIKTNTKLKEKIIKSSNCKESECHKDDRCASPFHN